MENEIWKDVEGYDGDYEISNYGRFKSLKKEGSPNIHEGSPHNTGYLKVGLWKNGNAEYEFIHRLVARVFIDNPDDKPQVNHKDNNKTNNHVENLEWVTASENIRHAIDNGYKTVSDKTKEKISKATQGESHGQSKLTEEDVLEIRNAYKLGCFTQRELGEAYGVGSDQISRIVNKKLWVHI